MDPNPSGMMMSVRLVTGQPAIRLAQSFGVQSEPMHSACHGPLDQLSVL
jgi:hypothetical protein